MPDVGDMVQARIMGQLLGQPVINNLSFVLVSPFGTWSEAATALTDALETALGVLGGGGPWVTNRSNQYTVAGVQVLDISPGVAPLHEATSSAVGALEGPSMPPNDCVCMTLRSNFRGPSGRGRMYLSGYTETDSTSGFWEAAVQDSVSAIGSALDDEFGELAGSSSFRWCILHRLDHGTPIIPPEVKPVMSFTIHNEVRSLGRRAMGRRISRRRTGP